MAHRHHGNFPQRRATLLPRVAKRGAGLDLALEVMSSETGSNPATTDEEPSVPAEHFYSPELSEIEKKWNESCSRRKRATSFVKQHSGKAVTALLKRIRIHPEAQRVLGNSCIPVVSLERLNFESVFFSSLQPVVSLVRLPIQTQTSIHRPQQNGFSQCEADIVEVEVSPQSDSSQPEPEPAQTSWTEPYCPSSSTTEEPEQGSGFDCDSNPDQPYILFDSGSDEWQPDGITHSETFYLDPDPEQNMVIQLDPEPDVDGDGSLKLEDDAETKWEVVQMDDSEDQRPGLCSSQDEADSSVLKPGSGSQAEEMESEDFCAVCLNGGDLLCCDRCPKVYHLSCHIPLLMSFPQGDWACTLCRSDQEPVETYDCENKHSCEGVRAPYTLSNQDQRRCETLTLMLYCHTLSAPFHEPVSVLARNYYQIIKRPVDLSLIRRKLDKSNTLHYFTAEQFVDDVLLMFKNCATFNYPDSEVAQAGQSLELFFLSKLKEIFPDQTFPSASQERTERVCLRWLCRKRKENYRKRKYVFSGKKYYL